MTLYAANVLDVAKPIEKKGKKATKKVEAPPPEPEPVAATPVKKELTEKQLAAIERRKLKRQEALAAKNAEQNAEEEAIRAKEEEIRAKEEEILRKKEEAKEKRRLARESRKALKQEESPPTSEASEETPVKVSKKRKERDEMEPPAWFQKYVAGVKKEEAKQSVAKIPKKEVMQEAKQAAQQQWNDGLTRDRVQNEVDAHMSRMYGMIFNNRRFK